jgi:hypothetical protein
MRGSDCQQLAGKMMAPYKQWVTLHVQIMWWIHCKYESERCLTRLTWLVYLMSMIEGTEGNHRVATVKITTLKAKIQTRDQQNRKQILIAKCCNKVYIASFSSHSLLSRQINASCQNLFYIFIYL